MSNKKIASKSIRVVLFGLGSVATETHNGGHLKQYLNDSEIDVIAGVDTCLNARNRALEKGIPVTYSTLEEAIEKEDFDFVSILTPTDKHLECCRLAALAKKNILCEKPIASSLEEALEIEKVVKKSGISFAVNMNLRFLPIVERIHEDINKGEYGKLFFLDFDECTSFRWTNYGRRKPENYSIASKSFWGNPKYYGLQRLIILDKAVHFIDLIKMWTGEKIKSVYVQGGCQGSHMDAGENLASINMTLSNSVQCRLFHTWGSHYDDRSGGELSTRIRIFGDRGTGVCDSSKKGFPGRYSIFRNVKEAFSMELHASERRDFAESLKFLSRTSLKKEINYQNLDSAIELMCVIEACYESLTTNSVIEVRKISSKVTEK